MKTSFTIQLTAAAVLLLAPCFMQQALAQGGSLTPPGAPAPTMRSLQEIFTQDTTTQTNVGAVQTSVNNLQDDARTPISSAPFTISTSGSYYLTGNLTVTTGDAIAISADDVTLDLNGFTISSTANPASGSAISLSGTRKNITIKNGSIQGTTTQSGGTFTTGGFSNGIFSSSSGNRNMFATGIHVNGVGNTGIALGNSTASTQIVELCTVHICGVLGIVAHTVRSSSASDCGNGGAIIATIVTDSTGVCVHPTLGQGISATDVVNCRGVSVNSNGINSSGNIFNCTGTSSSGTGVIAVNASNSTGTSTSGIGVDATNATNCVGSTATTGASLFGLRALGTASFCRGTNTGVAGVAISAPIAIGCTVGAGTVTSASKHLGTP